MESTSDTIRIEETELNNQPFHIKYSKDTKLQMTNKGDYLLYRNKTNTNGITIIVRLSETNTEPQFLKYKIFKDNEKKYYIEGGNKLKFNSVNDLVEHFKTNNIDKNIDINLKTPKLIEEIYHKPKTF